MGYSFLENHNLMSFSHIACMIGLIISQTHILINISIDQQVFHIPIFTLIYFTVSTTVLLVMVVNYAFFKGTTDASLIDFFQHIGVGLSVILFRLLVGRIPLDSYNYIVCFALLLLQCILIFIKIIYLGSVTKEFSQISGLTKLSRILKLFVTAIIPQFITYKLLLVIVLSLCELLTIFAFLSKYTYQKCSLQYVLLIGVFGGFISSLENMLSTIFEYEYYYLGEFFIIIIFFIPQTPLLSILQIKYTLLFTRLTQNKSEDEHLAQLAFLRECIFQRHQSLKISKETKIAAVLQIWKMCDITKQLRNKQSQNVKGDLLQDPYLMMNEIQKGVGAKFSQQFFQVTLCRFKQTSCFQVFSFIIDCALELPNNYSVFTLILFYGFRERTIHRRSNLEKCRYQIIYRLLANRFRSHYRNKQQISFLQFSDNLQIMTGLIEHCLSDKIQVFQALINHEKKSEMFIDSKLLKQNKIKQKIKNMIEECFKSQLFLSSNEFKYVYLLYHTAIQKKYKQLKKDLSYRFLSVEAKSKEAIYFPRYLTVLSGFNNGKIVKCNQSFKNYFKFVTKNQNKSSISQLFLNDTQRRKHNSLMSQYIQKVSCIEADHSKYECMLTVQAELNGFKFKALEKFRIITRIYCQNENGFNYVCQLVKIEEKNEDIITILKKERDLLEKKGLRLLPKNVRSITQLEDIIEICDIEGDFRNQSFASVYKISNHGQQQLQSQKELNVPETSVDKKIKLIQQKMVAGKRLNKFEFIHFGMFIYVILILMLSILIGVAFMKLQNQVKSFSFVITGEQKIIRDANLIRNRIMVEKLILSLVKGTQFFPDQICKFQQISNLSSYFINYMSQDITDNFDDFIDLIASPFMQDNMQHKMYSNQYYPTPYLFNYQKNITFQKYLYLLKYKEIYWLKQIENKVTFDQTYYSYIFSTQLISYSLLLNGSLYSSNEITTDSYQSKLIGYTNSLKIISMIANVVILISLIAIRIKDTLPLINILAAFESIDNRILIPKLKQLKYSLRLLLKIKTNRILSLEIDSKACVAITNDRQVKQNISVQNFTNQQKRLQKDNQNDRQNEKQEQNNTLLNYSQMQSSHILPQSSFIRALIYNKWYFLILIILISSIIVSCSLFIDGFATKIKALQSFQHIDQQLSLLNQKYINIVAYSWLKAYSLTNKTFNMTKVNGLFYDSLQAFKKMNFQKLFYQNYPSKLANQILYGNTCKYFLIPQLCFHYKTGIMTQGLSLILPFTIKQLIEGANISSTDYTYYIPQICDKTYILFEGIVPLNKKIPNYGLQVMLGNMQVWLLVDVSLVSLMVGFLLVMTLIWDIITRQNYQKIRQQVLSSDTVSNLYRISDLKPYFNKIYYE